MATTLTERLFRRLHARKMAAYAGIPGPTPSFPLGNARDFLKNKKRPWEVVAGYGQAHGGMVVFWIGGTPVVALSDPDLIARVLDAGASDYYKDAPKQALEPVITRRCLFIANGDDWAYRRKIHPAVGEAADEWLKSVVPALRDSVTSGADRLSMGDHRSGFDLYDGLERVSFDAFAVAAWGEPLGDEAYREFVALGKAGDRRMQTPLQFAPPLCPMFYADRRRWYGRFDNLIARARKDPDPARLDLLAVSLRKGPKVPHDDFRDLLANVFYGGVYSATSGLVTALDLLARHPQEEARLVEGLIGLDLGAPGVTPGDLEACPTLGATVLEALRYSTPVPLMARNVVTTRAVELGGHTLPSNTHLFLSSPTIHRSPGHWSEADRFDPSRWEPGGSATDPIGSPHFFPFGQGPRMCVGMPFAMTYMKVALATIIAKYRVRVDLGAAPDPSYFFGVMIPRGVVARFEAREAVAIGPSPVS
jgi:cytochrome P450